MSTSDPRRPLHDWVPPEEFDEYRVQRLLGRGAMGAVYLVRDSLLDRTVAVKFIGSGEPDRRDRRRFLIEARAIARLQHPNVVGIHRVGEVGGRPYLVSEFVHGQSLEKVHKPMPWQQALRIGVGLSRGLAAAHLRGVLHRDLKPSNAIVEEGGEAKLLDFGLAKLLDARAMPDPDARIEASVDASVDWSRDVPLALAETTEQPGTAPPAPRTTAAPPRGTQTGATRTGTLLGTPLYMSPEVWRGERATCRSDVYSLGVLLYELCAGRAPHDEAGRADLGRAITESDAPGLAAIAPDVHPLFASIVDCCLSRAAAARFASGEELRQALEQLVPPRQRIEWAAAEWERLDRSGEALWSERQLAEAALAVVDEAGLSPREASFLLASRRALRRRRLVRSALIVGLPLLLASAVVADKLRSRRRLDRLVAAQEARARAAQHEAQALHGKATEQRGRALSLFDAGGRRKDAEALWSGVLLLAGQAEEAYVRADQALEVALTLAGDRPPVRRRLGQIISERILLAEERHLPAQRRELLQRLPIHDPDGALQARLRAPASLTVTSVPPAAKVVIERYDDGEGRRRLRPVASWTASAAARPTAPGSYLLTVSAPDHEMVRYPLLLDRSAAERIAIELPAAGTVPAGYVYVPPGRFLFGSSEDETLRTAFLGAPPLHRTSTGAYLIARTEVTLSDWIEFLRALPEKERAERSPDVRSLRGLLQLEEVGEERWRFTLRPTTHTFSAMSGEPFRIGGRDRRAVQGWQRFPVAGISLGDARAYLLWLDRSGRLPGARLCTEKEWERAARGADDRIFAHGDRLEPDDANFDETYGREGFGPDEVGAHPSGASPFGVLDLVGNAFEWVASSGDEPAVIRGGAWYYDALTNRSNNREVVEPDMHDMLVGLRVCATWRRR